MKLDLELKLKLDFLGEGWDKCEMVFAPVSVAEARKMMNVDDSDQDEILKVGIDLIKSKFIRGNVLSEGKVVDMTVDTIEDLPVSVMEESINCLVGSMSKKK